MQTTQEFLDGTVRYEIPFTEMGETPASLSKRSGKVGFRASLTEWVRTAIRRKRQTNPIAPNQADIVKWILYDRAQFSPGTTVPSNFKFFTQPIGTNAKTKIDTNLDQVQRLPDPLWYNTEGIGFYFSATNTLADINAFLQSEYMEYWVGQKVYIEGPIQCFPGAAGLFGSAQTQIALTNGLPRADNLFDVRLPAGIHLGADANNVPIVTDGLIGVTILQGQQFRVEMNAPSGGAALTAAAATPPGTGLTVGCYLYGILSRGVQ
jgi:hypothetical protein